MATVTDPAARRLNNALELLHNPDRGYLQPGESPLDMYRRTAKAAAGAEAPPLRAEWEEKFFSLMVEDYFKPNTPTLMHAGVPVPEGRKPKCLSACFVDSPDDDLDSITRIGYEIPHIESAGGGIGWGLSKLRPKGDVIREKQGVACGPVDVLRWYAQAGRTFTQGASRPGAHMAQLHISHPDILEFIHVKDNCLSPDDPLANVNISVQIPDTFIYAVENNLPWGLVNPRNGHTVRRVPARELWQNICESAWLTGDPGVVFIDRINTPDGPLNPEYGPINSSNPCFTGDMKVWTTDGPQRFDELMGRSVEVLTWDDHGQTVRRMMRDIRVTQQDASLTSVTVSDELGRKSTILCTFDHKFYLTSGEPVEAQELKPGESLHSLYRVYCEGAVRAPAVAANHQVVSVEHLGRREDVYCGTVDEFHRFYLVTEEDGLERIGAVGVANCGEQFLEDGGSCNLGSLNLAKYVLSPPLDGVRDLGRAPEIDWELLEEHIHTAVRFLDNVVDINWFPFERQREVNLNTRRIGLGVMGVADMFAMMGIPYNSAPALVLSRQLGEFIRRHARSASVALGQEKGELREGHPARNSAVTTIAPTGSISIIAGCSSGVEPYFDLFWKRKAIWTTDGREHASDFLEMPAPLRDLFDLHLPEMDLEERMDELVAMESHEQRDWVAEHLGRDVVDLFPTAHQIEASEHVRMQAAWQENIDNGISKTINLPARATMHDVRNVFIEAHALGCKAVTIYRDRSKNEQVLSAGRETDETTDAPTDPGSGGTSGVPIPAARPPVTEEAVVVFDPADPRTWPNPKERRDGLAERPRSLPGTTTAVETGHGTAYITINRDPDSDQPFEIFIANGNNDPCKRAAAVAVARLVSMALRSDVDVRILIDALRGLDCGHPHWSGGVLRSSLWDALARLLLEGLDEPYDEIDEANVPAIAQGIDPHESVPSVHRFRPENGRAQLLSCFCGSTDFIHQNGCVTCRSCGRSGCS